MADTPEDKNPVPAAPSLTEQGLVGAILAGGASRRMGRDKAVIALGDQVLLDRVIKRVVPQVSCVMLIGGPQSRAQERGFDYRPDAVEGGHGPLAGILAAMDYADDISSSAPFVFVTATDMPFLPPDLIKTLLGAVDGNLPVLPRSGGYLQPLAALWPRQMQGVLARALKAGIENERPPALKAIYRASGCVEVGFEDQPEDPFFNINSPRDLEQARLRLGL